MAVITIPATPSAPASFSLTLNDAVALSISPFTGQQQVQRWGVLPRELSVSWPPMTKTQAQAWITFLTNLNGITNTFVFSTAFGTAYPEIGSRSWRLKSNMRNISVGEMRMYGFQFDLREAL